MVAATPLQFQQLMDSFQNINPAIMFLLILWSMINCFLGYLIFRAVLTVNGLILGGIIGNLVLASCHSSPTAIDGFVAALVGGTLPTVQAAEVAGVRPKAGGGVPCLFSKPLHNRRFDLS